MPRVERSGAIVVFWASPIPGRESKLPGVLHDVLAFGERLRQAGRVDEVRVFVPKAGRFHDTLMLFGRLDSLMTILIDEEFEALLLEGTLVVQDLSIAVWEGGAPEWIGAALAPYAGALEKHKLL